MPGTVRSPVIAGASSKVYSGGVPAIREMISARRLRGPQAPCTMCGAMAQPWDQRTIADQRRTQNALVNGTLVQMALAHVPFTRAKLQAAGLDARMLRKVDDLQKVPTSMRRDVVDPVRNPDGPQAFVLKGTAEGVKRFSDRSVLRRVALSRLFGGEEVQQLAIEAASRGVHAHIANGPGGPIPISYTRDDLDLLARAGSRLAQLAGIDR